MHEMQHIRLKFNNTRINATQWIRDLLIKPKLFQYCNIFQQKHIKIKKKIVLRCSHIVHNSHSETTTE